MKKKVIGSVLAGLGVVASLGINGVSAASNINSHVLIKDQFQKAEMHNQITKPSAFEQSVIDKVTKKNFRSLALTGNTYYETEPNDTFAQANYLGQGDIIAGTFSYNDVDTYAINVTQPGQVIIAGAISTTSLANIGFLLFDANGNLLKWDNYKQGDHSFGEKYTLQPGTYYIQAFNTTANVTNDVYGIAWDMAGQQVPVNPPAPPVLNPVYDNSNTLTGTTGPGDTVSVMSNGVQVGSPTAADQNGTFSVSIPHEAAGTQLSVVSKDSLGNVSSPSDIVVMKAPSYTGWAVEQGQHYYYVNGVKQKGWELIGGKWYYFNKNTSVVTTGWLLDGGKWYYLNPNGDMKTGWLLYKNNWYYLNPNGSMATGWVLTGGKWYYLYNSGIMAHDTKIGSYRLGHDGAWIR